MKPCAVVDELALSEDLGPVSAASARAAAALEANEPQARLLYNDQLHHAIGLLARQRAIGTKTRPGPCYSIEEAIALANGSVYTSNQHNAFRLSRKVRAGVVTVNDFGKVDITTPFGSYYECRFWLA